MKFEWLKKDGQKKLAIIFNGWGFDANAFNPEAFEGFDLLICEDYTDLYFKLPEGLDAYDETCLIAWSFGVWVAERFFDEFKNIKMSVAVNGSHTPVSDELGIPHAVFEATLSSYDESAKEKFLTRIMGGRKALKDFECALPKRDAAKQKEELAALGAYFENAKPRIKRQWTRVIASDADKIFPLENLKRAWGDNLEEISSAHYPAELFQKNFMRGAFLKPSVKKSFEKHLATYDANAAAQKLITKRLAAEILKHPAAANAQKVLEIGCGTCMLTKELLKGIKNASWTLNDISPEVKNFIPQEIAKSAKISAGSAENADFGLGFDLAVSSSALQWVDDLKGVFAKVRTCLKTGGIFAFSSFGKNNLWQIKKAAQSGLEYRALEECRALLDACGFEVSESFEDEITLNFTNAADALRHLKNTGVTGGFARFWTPAKMRDFAAKLADAGGGNIALTYHPIYFITKKK